jgi:hypothetical protein
MPGPDCVKPSTLAANKMRHIYITIVLFALMLVINFTNIPYRLIILLALAIGIGINQIYLTKSIIKRNLSGQKVIRKQKQSIGISTILVALTWTVFAIVGQEDEIYVALLFWALLLAGLISNRIFKKEKPISIVVDNNHLLINNVWLIKRSIETLTGISLNGLTDNIVLSFSDKSAVTIDRGNYNDADITDLLRYLAEQSAQKVTISENLMAELAVANKSIANSGA